MPYKSSSCSSSEDILDFFFLITKYTTPAINDNPTTPDIEPIIIMFVFLFESADAVGVEVEPGVGVEFEPGVGVGVGVGVEPGVGVGVEPGVGVEVGIGPVVGVGVEPGVGVEVGIGPVVGVGVEFKSELSSVVMSS